MIYKHGLTALLIGALVSLGLSVADGLIYSYSLLTTFEAAAGVCVLSLTAVFVWLYQRHAYTDPKIAPVNQSATFGLTLGILWVIEISINNFIAPPLPARDVIDNLFWAAVALSILVYSFFQAFNWNSFKQGLAAGAWSGFASGLAACCMALGVILFAMDYLMRDPLNIAEWAQRQVETQAPGMAAYFAFETFAGAFVHLIVLGILMGAILGLAGGVLGKGVKKILVLLRIT
jgi:hypothetical protein